MIYVKGISKVLNFREQIKDYNKNYDKHASADGASKKTWFYRMFYRSNIIFYNNKLNLWVSRHFGDLIDFKNFSSASRTWYAPCFNITSKYMYYHLSKIEVDRFRN